MADTVDYTDKYDVFLSYRRDGGETMAMLLRDRLAAKGYRVFLDVESLNSGSFNKRLLQVIEECTDVIVVCSKGSLDRCMNEGDWVRLEVAHALAHDKNVVPVLLRGFEWPDVLPDDIEALRMQNGINANSSEYFDAAVDRMGKFLYSQPQGNTAAAAAGAGMGDAATAGSAGTAAAAAPTAAAGVGDARAAGAWPAAPKKPLPKKAKGLLIAAASLAVVAALVVGGILLWGQLGGAGSAGPPAGDPSGDDPQVATTDDSETTPNDSGDTAGQQAPVRTVVANYEVTYPSHPVTIPSDATKFSPKGIATIKQSDGKTVSAIANTLIYVDDDGYVIDGLRIDDSSTTLFSEMGGFQIKEANGTTQALITLASGAEFETESINMSDNIVFLTADETQQGRIIKLSTVESVSFDWTATPPEIQKYMLVRIRGGTPMAVPQEMLFFHTLHVNNGIGFRETSFDIPLENPPNVSFQQIGQLAVTQHFTLQYGEGFPFDCFSVEMKLRTGDVLTNDIYRSYYRPQLYCLTNLGPAEIYFGDLETIQFVDG